MLIDSWPLLVVGAWHLFIEKAGLQELSTGLADRSATICKKPDFLFYGSSRRDSRDCSRINHCKIWEYTGAYSRCVSRVVYGTSCDSWCNYRSHFLKFCKLYFLFFNNELCSEWETARSWPSAKRMVSNGHHFQFIFQSEQFLCWVSCFRALLLFEL